MQYIRAINLYSYTIPENSSAYSELQKIVYFYIETNDNFKNKCILCRGY